MNFQKLKDFWNFLSFKLKNKDGLNRIYFETSAVNYLYDNIFNDEKHSSIKTKKLQIKKGRKWYISNITLWEIFLTKNDSRRTDLFDFSRSLFYNDLIVSPEEIIINYIKKGCPVVEKFYNLKSKSLFSKEWKIASKKHNYFFEPDKKEIENHTFYYRFLGKYFTKVLNGYELDFKENSELIKEEKENYDLEKTFNKLIKLYGRNINKEHKKLLSISFQITLVILCYGICFDQPTIENFWNKIGIDKPLKRLEYTVDNFSDIFFRGPIVNISKMMILQAEKGSSRGVYFDAIHSIYTTYVDLYVSNDQHFLNFKKTNNSDFNMLKIVSVKDLKFQANQ